VALALRGAGFAPGLAGTGWLQPAACLNRWGALLGVGLVQRSGAGLPASGSDCQQAPMIFVVSHEVIPKPHRNGHQTPATLG